MSEPKIHSHIEDVLDDSHPLAYAHLDCKDCGALIHAANNECMRTWVETGAGNFCLQCFTLETGFALEDQFGLPTP